MSYLSGASSVVIWENIQEGWIQHSVDSGMVVSWLYLKANSLETALGASNSWEVFENITLTSNSSNIIPSFS